MKLGIITDIHNNCIALKTVTERLLQMDCEKIICCGDIIGIGPFPEETVQYMMRIPGLIAVRGNHEKYLLEGMPSEYPNEEHMSYEEMKHHKWEYSLLSVGSVEFLRSLPYRMDLELEGCRLSVMHFCMDRDGHYVHYRRNPSEEDLKEMFAGIESDIILYGHDHSRCICRGNKFYINAGSLGCPAEKKNIARAAVLDIKNGKAETEPLDMEYDINDVIKAIDRINYPDAWNIKRFFFGIL